MKNFVITKKIYSAKNWVTTTIIELTNCILLLTLVQSDIGDLQIMYLII